MKKKVVTVASPDADHNADWLHGKKGKKNDKKADRGKKAGGKTR